MPKKTKCDHTIFDGLFTECDDKWNCGNCTTDMQYKWPVPSDGKIMIQTNFKNPQNPGAADAWGTFITIKLYDENDNLITAVLEDISSQHIVGHTGKYGYQTIELDFSKINIDCGYFKIETTNGDELCTQLFRKEDCNQLIEIEGNYSDIDCWNNYYDVSKYGYVGTSNFKYSNKIYLKGSIKIDTLNAIDRNVNETLRFLPSELIAPYMAKYLTYKILNSKSITIGDELWYDSGNVLKVRDKSNMFLPSLIFNNEGCGENGGCVVN